MVPAERAGGWGEQVEVAIVPATKCQEKDRAKSKTGQVKATGAADPENRAEGKAQN